MCGGLDVRISVDTNKVVFVRFLGPLLGHFFGFLGSLGEPGGMSGTPHRQARLQKGFWTIFGSLFGHSGDPLGGHGADQEPPRWPADATPEAC